MHEDLMQDYSISKYSILVRKFTKMIEKRTSLICYINDLFTNQEQTFNQFLSFHENVTFAALLYSRSEFLGINS